MLAAEAVYYLRHKLMYVRIIAGAERKQRYFIISRAAYQFIRRIEVAEDSAEIIKAKALSRLTKQLQEAQDDPVSYSEDEVYKMFGVEK